MILITALADNGIRIDMVEEINSVSLSSINPLEVKSEDYLLEIERVIEERNGWSSVSAWYTSVGGESFTSLRGLIVHVNALSMIHDIPVFVFKEQLEDAVKAEVPIVPEYSSEPNITIRKA